ncbi:MAG: lysine--tRNA ligase [Desulfobacteraceae bacterium]|nr:lysine--tRNA ligase [Desulfobacteraceae bacterium]MCB9494849.1 lysine--tRNA ligase [Desulfobacteraceae bacterium]
MNDKRDLLEQRREKNKSIADSGVNLYPNNFKVESTIDEIRSIIEESPEKLGEEGLKFTIAGRMMAVNKFGKSSFIRIKDGTGQRMQAYLAKDRVGDDSYSLFKQLDIGDIVGVSGPLFQTKTGEWTIYADSFSLLSKSVRPLPEKFHGLKDPEKRYRRRYVDLIMNEDVRNIFTTRAKIVQTIREFLTDKKFLEVETPMMQPIAGGAEATPFVTHHNALDMKLYLRIAPELYLKRLVVGGFDRVFEINRNFRNEGVSTRHNPEFTMLEFYQAYSTYKDLMDLTEELFLKIANKVSGSSEVEYQDEKISFKNPWKRISLTDALCETAGMDKSLLTDKDGLLRFAEEKGVTITKKEKTGKIITKLFETLVEPKLIQPTFVTDYPVEVSPLSRRNDENPEFTERFELFIGGREIANGFSELNDPDDQRERFLDQVRKRDEGDLEAHMMDTDYVEALEYGMPPTAGEGIGIDRLVMLFTNAPSIREVILFPHMRPSSEQ